MQLSRAIIDYAEINTVFSIKPQSPTAHLRILRDPTQFSGLGSLYFSPALGNGSDAWARFRANRYLGARIAHRKLVTVTKFAKELDAMTTQGREEAQNEIARQEARFSRMEHSNPAWVLNIAETRKVISRVDSGLEETFGPTRTNITEELEELMRKEGRSLSEKEGLERAVHDTTANTFWPAGYDLDEETCSEDSNDDYNSGDDDEEYLCSFPIPKSVTSPGHPSIDSKQDEHDDADKDDDDDDEQLYSFPSFPFPNSVVAVEECSSDQEQGKSDQDSISQSHLPDFETRFEDLVNNLYDTICNELQISKQHFKKQQIVLPAKTPNWWGDECKWIVHPLSMNPKKLQASLTGIPTIRLITPAGQVCELQETFQNYDGPEWDEWFQWRRTESNKLREKLKDWETFSERCSRLEAEDYWESVKIQDWDRAMRERIQLYEHHEGWGHSTGYAAEQDVDSNEGHSTRDVTGLDFDSKNERSSSVAINDIEPSGFGQSKNEEAHTEVGSRVRDLATDIADKDDDDYYEDLFTPPTVSTTSTSVAKMRALANLNEWKTILCSKVKEITRRNREKKDEDERIKKMASIETSREPDGSYEDRLRTCLVSFDLRARLNDGLILHISNNSVFYTNDGTKNNKSQGPNEVRFIGPLLDAILENRWILEQPSQYVRGTRILGPQIDRSLSKSKSTDGVPVPECERLLFLARKRGLGIRKRDEDSSLPKQVIDGIPALVPIHESRYSKSKGQEKSRDTTFDSGWYRGSIFQRGS